MHFFVGSTDVESAVKTSIAMPYNCFFFRGLNDEETHTHRYNVHVHDFTHLKLVLHCSTYGTSTLCNKKKFDKHQTAINSIHRHCKDTGTRTKYKVNTHTCIYSIRANSFCIFVPWRRSLQLITKVRP